jgi:DUF4097 and DUF4098 domain-containing protein YvlB
LLPLAMLAQGTLIREGGRWVQTITERVPAASRLRVNTSGPVHLEGSAATEVAYTARLSVAARNEAEARRILERYRVRAVRAGEWLVLSAPGEPVVTTLSVKAPRLEWAIVTTEDGAVEANGIDGPLDIESGAGELKCNRIRGDCRLTTGGGDIRVGEVDGGLHAATAGGRVIVKTVRGDAILETAGGDIEIGDAGANVRANTAGGAVRVTSAAGSVAATTGGGPIAIGRAGGLVIARNVAGPVQVGAAAGVRCESGTGGVRVNNVSGPLLVSTAAGSIVAGLLSGKPMADSLLETGNGDITVLIPQDLGITIRAENAFADTVKRIVSDFPSVPVRIEGMRLVAEGQVNGGGPLLRISGTGGTIFIKRQP